MSYWAHYGLATSPTDVLEASINFIGISGYPGIYRMTQFIPLNHKQYLIESKRCIVDSIPALKILRSVLQVIVDFYKGNNRIALFIFGSDEFDAGHILTFPVCFSGIGDVALYLYDVPIQVY